MRILRVKSNSTSQRELNEGRILYEEVGTGAGRLQERGLAPQRMKLLGDRKTLMGQSGEDDNEVY